MIIGIIGAGASGMAAALAASENPEHQIEIFERQARVGRKLQATGNGRCNLSNIHAEKSGFHGEDPNFAMPALEYMGPIETCQWFQSLGLFTVTEENGRVYPYSDHANSVVDILRLAMERPNICLHTAVEVKKVQRVQGGFLVISEETSVFCHRVIVACGGLAGTKLGGSMSGYKLLSQMGHKVTKLRPALVQLKTSWGGVAGLKGIRANCSVQILRDGQCFAESAGELQFTDYGLSGPVIFEVSRDVCCGSGVWTAQLDFLPQVTMEDLHKELLCRREKKVPVEELLTGILHNRLGRVLTRAAGVREKWEIADLSDGQLLAVCQAVKAFELELTEPMGMDSAQVTAGGVITTDFDPKTMQSKLMPGIFACGEVLDIDGDCGGYNLQWAWSSGYLAGKSAGEME